MSPESPASADAEVVAGRLRRRRRAALRNLITAIIVLWPVMLQLEERPPRLESLRVLGPPGPGAATDGVSGSHAGRGTSKLAASSRPLIRLAQLGDVPMVLEAQSSPPGAGAPTGGDAGLDVPVDGAPIFSPYAAPGPDGGPIPALPAFPTPPYVTGPGGLPAPGGPPSPPVITPTNPLVPPVVTPPQTPPALTPPDNPPVIAPPGQPPPIAGPPSVPGNPPGFPTPPGPGGPGGGGPGGGGPPPVSGVPEPVVWLQLIVGFGVLGAAMRRRRGQPPTALRARSSA